MQLECNGQVCESYREREQASSSGVRRDDLGVFARVFGIAAPASGSVLYVFYHGRRRTCSCTTARTDRRLAAPTNFIVHVRPPRGAAVAPGSRTRAPRCRRRGARAARWRGLERGPGGREVDDARSRDIFHLHTTKPNTLSSGSADPRHQRLRRAASL
jgi:hypothetical protein